MPGQKEGAGWDPGRDDELGQRLWPRLSGVRVDGWWTVVFITVCCVGRAGYSSRVRCRLTMVRVNIKEYRTISALSPREEEALQERGKLCANGDDWAVRVGASQSYYQFVELWWSLSQAVRSTVPPCPRGVRLEETRCDGGWWWCL